MDLSQTDVFANVYQRYRRLVLTSAWRILRDRDLAEDVTQDVFAWLWTHPRAYDGRGTLATYLALVARSRAIDAWRSADARIRLDERLRTDAVAEVRATDEGALVGTLVRRDDAGELRALMADLPRRQGEALLLRYWADMPPAAIAARLGVPESTAKARLWLGRQNLSRRLRPVAA